MSTADRKIDGHVGEEVCVLKSGGKASVNTNVLSSERTFVWSLFVNAVYVYMDRTVLHHSFSPTS